jgi:putative nucleotidyltransferase with HDIG domain
MTLKIKLTIGFIVVSLLIGVSSYFSTQLIEKSLESQFIASDKVLTLELLHKVDEYIQSRIIAFEEYSSRVFLREALLESNREFEKSSDMQDYIALRQREWASAANAEATPLMQNLLRNRLSVELTNKRNFYNKKYGFNMINEIFVTNKYGADIALTNRIPDYRHDDELWWQSARRDGLYIKDIERHESSDGYAVPIAFKIVDARGNFLGVLKVSLNLEGVVRILNTINQHEFYNKHTATKLYLTTKDGKLIYSSNKNEKLMSKVSCLIPESGDLTHKSGQVDVYDSIIPGKDRKDDLLIVHAHSTGYGDYKGLGWILTVEHKAQEAFRPFTDLTNRILAVSLAVTILVVVIGVAISSKVTSSVRKLRDAAVSIGRGDLDTVVDIKSHDEIGQLAKEFQLMASNLKSTTVRLDEFAREVAERKQSDEMLRQSRQDWMDTFNTITDTITIHDKNYNIIRANKAAVKTLNLPNSLMNVKAKCYQHYHGTNEPPGNCPSCVCLRTGKPAVSEVFEPHLNSHVEIRAIPRFNMNNQLIGLIHVVRDISDRKKKEELIQTQLERLNALRTIDKAIIGSMDLRISLDIFLDQVVTQLKIDAATVLLFNKHSQVLEYAVSKGFRTCALKHTKLRVGDSNAGKAAREQRIVTIPDIRDGMHGFTNSAKFASEDFVTYIAVPLIAKGQVKGVLELFHRSPLNTSADWMEFLEAIADQGAIATDNATLFNDLQRSNVELTLAYDTTIEGWSRAMDLRDRETEGHSQRVSEMTLRIAREMGVREENIVHMRRGALLHDIGKIGVPDSILLKRGPLSDGEWDIMKKHPEYAYNMLRPIEYLRPAIDIPYSHHEMWDGSGYPGRLKGEDIPLAARIFALVDVWDALNSDRPYRPRWPEEKIKDHILSLSGTHFDPRVVEAFLNIQEKDNELYDRQHTLT